MNKTFWFAMWCVAVLLLLDAFVVWNKWTYLASWVVIVIIGSAGTIRHILKTQEMHRVLIRANAAEMAATIQEMRTRKNAPIQIKEGPK